MAATPLGRLGTAEEIARAALFLASDDASYLVGSNLLAAGGGGVRLDTKTVGAGRPSSRGLHYRPNQPVAAPI
ncbi:MAG: SDR family oxidoreductase [Hymenobacter sp.]